MRGVLQTYLPLFLEKDGSVQRETTGVRALAEFLTGVVAVGTRAAAGKRPGRVACRCHTATGPCPGVICAAVEARPSRLEWWCPVCGDSGAITGWQGTPWDRSKPVRRVKAVKQKQRSRAA